VQILTALFTDKRWHHRKGIAIYNAIEGIYNRKFGVTEQKGVFEHC
jgi:hypothetical protein